MADQKSEETEVACPDCYEGKRLDDMGFPPVTCSSCGGTGKKKKEEDSPVSFSY